MKPSQTLGIILALVWSGSLAAQPAVEPPNTPDAALADDVSRLSIDVIDHETLAQTGWSETNQVLASLNAAYQANHQVIRDGTDHVDPASLRNLGPDQMLVLVNGKRRHKSALLHTTNTFGRGTAGTDLNAIPLSAIERIEVVRTGAVARYGADAIAGVINVVLKDTATTTEVITATGITASGDGEVARVGFNHGYPIGTRGSFNMTGEFLRRNPTNRAGTWTGDTFYDPDHTYEQTTDALEQNGLSRDAVRMRVGQTRATVGSLVANLVLPTSWVELYAFANASYRASDGGGFYRRPEQRDRIDLERYPNGFLPQIHADILDWSLAIGGRGTTGPWTYDVSATHGGNLFMLRVENTLNASLGAAGAAAVGVADDGTSFDVGGQGFIDSGLQFDLTRIISTRWFDTLLFRSGGGLRLENFRQLSGEIASYAFGNETVEGDDPQPKVPGTQAFPGYRPDNEVSANRFVISSYAGVDSDITSQWSFGAIGRLEAFGDIGGVWAGELSTRYEPFAGYALRVALTHGYRAPSLHQEWFSAVSTLRDGNSDQLIQVLQARIDSVLIDEFGIPKLRKETSNEVSVGVSLRPLTNLIVTADAYRITIDDRIVLSSRFSDAIDGVADVLNVFPGVSQVQFPLNVIDTETLGVHVVASYERPIAGGILGLSGAISASRHRIRDIHVPESLIDELNSDRDTLRHVLVDVSEQNRIERWLPQIKGSLTASYRVGQARFLARARHFGASRIVRGIGDSANQTFGATTLFDVELGYQLHRNLGLSLGADNAFNTFPDEMQHPSNHVAHQFRYLPTQFSTNGAMYYARLQYRR